MQNRRRQGQLEVITGCMFAGKTEELLSRLRQAEVAGRSIGVFSPKTDDRYNEKSIVSHSGQEWIATVIEPDEQGAEQIRQAADEFDVIAVDEANFFDSSLVEATQIAADRGARVIVSGIDQTFRGEPFEPLHALMAVADTVDKRAAVCEKCAGRATRTQRLIDGDPVPASAPTIQVGGEESYEARCRQCHEVPELNRT